MSVLIFGKYELHSRLAIGGMGEVFYGVQRAEVKGFERPVILKNLLPELAQQDGFVEQFLDEARVAATLNHPNVVSIYEVGKWNGVYFLAMEYISGRNLAQLIRASIRQSVPISAAVAAQIIHDAALGLDHAHQAKDGQGQPLHLVHRDISPQNIMVREDGVTKVVDFGIARANNRASRTATGAVKGKLAYMAPEQIRAEHLSPQADLFSLGVVLWELATRTRLFQAPRDIDLIKAVLEQPIAPPSRVSADVPPELDEIALKLLERDTSKRYRTGAEVARDLESFLAKFSSPGGDPPVVALMSKLGREPMPEVSGPNFMIPLASPPSPDTRSLGPQTIGSSEVVDLSTRTASPTRRRSLGVAAALVLVAAAVGGYFAFRPAAEPEPTPPKPIATVEKEAAPAPPPTPAGPLMVHLTVTSVPRGGVVTVEGKRSGETPVNLDVPGGRTVKVRVDKAGWLAQERDVTLVAEGEQTAAFTLKPAPKTVAKADVAPPPTGPEATGVIAVSSDPEAVVSIDGSLINSTPCQFHAPLGRHALSFETKTGQKAVREVMVTAKGVAKVVLTPADFK